MTLEEAELSGNLKEAAKKSASQYYVNGGYSPFPNVKTAAHEAGFIAGVEWIKAKMLEWTKERYQQTISNVGCYTGHSVWAEVIEHINEM